MKSWKPFLLIVFIGFLYFTNPTLQKYKWFSENKYGEIPNNPELPMEIERINFLLFSTFTPIIGLEAGITHLGIMGQFIQISDGQFDYPVWLELFH
ncbi:hypothetical protein [Peribacillus alkalitolerans]|uniref:hypothetical protein n=1 Tax=Peribacillus alkalitolerans TaxID=1550385 RepID=UPI0013D35107|nr:hypothetical protein [Peribacillus alkalitolerans]